MRTSTQDGKRTKQIDSTSGAYFEWLLPATIACAVISFFGVIVAYPFWFWDWSKGGPESWGAYGDFFGGVLNPVVAFAALVALLYGLRIQRKELEAAREQLAESARAQIGLVAATTKSHHFVYASSLVPLLEASRLEIIAIMESKTSLVARCSGTKTIDLSANQLFRQMRLYTSNVNGFNGFNLAVDETQRFFQRISDRLFSIFSLCIETEELTGSRHISKHYLNVVGGLILDLQQYECLPVPTYAEDLDVHRMLDWAQATTSLNED